MRKVFCSECKHLQIERDSKEGNTHYNCNAPKEKRCKIVIKDNFFERGEIILKHNDYANCEIKNKRNKCKDFEKKED